MNSTSPDQFDSSMPTSSTIFKIQNNPFTNIEVTHWRLTNFYFNSTVKRKRERQKLNQIVFCWRKMVKGLQQQNLPADVTQLVDQLERHCLASDGSFVSKSAYYDLQLVIFSLILFIIFQLISVHFAKSNCCWNFYWYFCRQGRRCAGRDCGIWKRWYLCLGEILEISKK